MPGRLPVAAGTHQQISPAGGEAQHPPADWVALAEVGAPIGLKGAVRLHTLKSVTGLAIDDSLLASAPDCWLRLRDGSWRYDRIVECSPQTRGLKLQLSGIHDRDQAEALRAASVGLSRKVFPEVAEGENYWADLIGAEVVNRQGESLGSVVSMQTNGEYDWLVLTRGLIPFVAQYIDRVDQERHRIEVDWLMEWFS